MKKIIRVLLAGLGMAGALCLWPRVLASPPVAQETAGPTLFDALAEKPGPVLQAKGLEAFSALFSPDSRRIALAGFPMTPPAKQREPRELLVMVFEVDTGRCLGQIPVGTTESVLQFNDFPMAWSNNGAFLSLGMNGRIHVLDVQSYKLLRSQVLGLPNCHQPGRKVRAAALTFSPDDKRIFTADDWGRVIAWNRDDLSSQEMVPFQPIGTGDSNLLLASADGHWLVWHGAGDGGLRILDLGTGAVALTLKKSDGTLPMCDQLWNGTMDGNPRMAAFREWDTRTGGLARRAVFLTEPARHGSLSADGKWLLAEEAQARDRRQFLDTATGVRRWLRGSALTVLSPSGQWTLFSKPYLPNSHFGETFGWVEARRKGGVKIRWKAHPFMICNVATDRSGRVLATTGEEWGIKVWETATGKLLHKLQGHFSEDVQLLMNPDGSYLASRSSNEGQGVLVWDLQAGALLLRIPGGSEFAFHPSESWIQVGGTLWDLKSRTILQRITDFKENSASSLEFSPDGKLVVYLEDVTGFNAEPFRGYLIHVLDGRTLIPLKTLPMASDGGRPYTAFSPGGGRFWCWLEEGDFAPAAGRGMVYDTRTWKSSPLQDNKGHFRIPPGLAPSYPPHWMEGGDNGLVSGDGMVVIKFGGYVPAC